LRNLEKILRLVRSLPIDSNDTALLLSFKELLANTQTDISTKLYNEILHNPLGNKDIILNQVPEPFTQYVRGFRSILARNAKLNNPYQYLNTKQVKDLNVQAQLVGKAERQILALRQAMNSAVTSIKKDIQSAITNGINPGQLEARLTAINQQLTHVESVYSRYISNVIPQAYANGAEITKNILESPAIIDNKFLFDNKTVNSLIKHATDDFTRGIAGSRDLIGFSFKVSKQAFLTEQEISQLVAAEYMASGDAKQVQKKVFEAFANLQGRNKNPSSAIVTAQNRDITNLEADAQFEGILQTKINALRNQFPNMTQAQFEKRMAKTLKALNEEKYIRIINKNGEYMHFTLDHYSELVTRTRIGDSQVAGTMEMAIKDGIDLFRITSHNTTSAQCISHEGQFYSTNPKLIGKNFQGKKIGEASRANLPLYHPGNCLHRVVAVPYLDDEISGLDSTEQNTAINNVTPQGQISEPASGTNTNTPPSIPMDNTNTITPLSQRGARGDSTTPQNTVLQDLINNRNSQIAKESRKSANLANARKQFELTGQDIEQAQAGIDSGSIAPFSFADLTYSNKTLYDGISRIIQSKIDGARALLERQMLPDAVNKALIPIIKKLSSEKYVRVKNEAGKWVFLTLKEARQAGLKF
jgi:hypothetical protein